MTNTTKMNRAEKAITEMPRGFWIKARDLAKNARLGVGTMTKLSNASQKAWSSGKQTSGH